jgi:programmed cell death protein 5
MSKVPISEEQAQRMMAQQQQQEQQQQMHQEQREGMLRVVLSPEARERLKRIEQVKPERAQMVENNIIMACRQGKLQPPVGDDVVREMLSAVSDASGGSSGGGTKITFARKTRMDDDW